MSTVIENRVAPAIKIHRNDGQRFYFDVAVGAVCISGKDTGGAFCLLDFSVAPGVGVPRHTHTLEDETYFVIAGQLEVIIDQEVFVLGAGDSLMAPRNIPHQLRNPGEVENRYLIVFSPSGFEKFLEATAKPAEKDARPPQANELHAGDPAATIALVHELSTNYGILFD